MRILCFFFVSFSAPDSLSACENLFRSRRPFTARSASESLPGNNGTFFVPPLPPSGWEGLCTALRSRNSSASPRSFPLPQAHSDSPPGKAPCAPHPCCQAAGNLSLTLRQRSRIADSFQYGKFRQLRLLVNVPLFIIFQPVFVKDPGIMPFPAFVVRPSAGKKGDGKSFPSCLSAPT